MLLRPEHLQRDYSFVQCVRLQYLHKEGQKEGALWGGEYRKKNTLPTDAPRKAKQSAKIKLPIKYLELFFCFNTEKNNLPYLADCLSG